MNTLLLKLILTPTLIGAASLAGRRWGPSISGWLVGLPLTSGPVIFYLALSQGTSFARTTAMGILTGTITQAVFCLAYAWLALRFDWPVAAAASAITFFAVTAVLQNVTLPLGVLFIVVVLTLIVAFRLMPLNDLSASPTTAPPLWEIPARMLTATVFVLLITGLASTLGPHLTGLLTPFPTFAIILAAFAHHQRGPTAANGVLRGLLLGLFSFACFFLILASMLESFGTGVALAMAISVALIIQAGALWLLRRR
jgi:uncharacterized membrane protein (GlpM family)